MTPYAVRPARAGEYGRWVIIRNGLPNAVLADGFILKHTAARVARRWKRRDAAARNVTPV